MIYAKEYAACMVDVVEDFLEEKGFNIPNEEHEGGTDEAIIYGSDFDYLFDKFIEVIKNLCNDAEVEINTDDWMKCN